MDFTEFLEPTLSDDVVEVRALDGPLLVAALLAVDPAGLGGALVDHPLHEQARAFTNAIQRLLPDHAPQRRVPIGVSADRLIGGVDLAATLSTGRLVSERGVLAAADGGVVVLPMCERVSVSVRTTLSEVLDTATVQVARDGIGATHDVRVVAVLLDESVEDEAVHPALVDRVAFRLNVRAAPDEEQVEAIRAQVHAARARLATVSVDDSWVTALCETTEAFGIDSVRAPLFALRCARAHAALAGRDAVANDDAEAAARMVLAPRATRVPVEPPPPPAPESAADETPPPEPPDQNTPPEPPPPENSSEEQAPENDENDAPDEQDAEQPLPSDADLLRAAVAAALPPGLLEQLMAKASAGGVQGRVGAEEQSLLRGRPRGARSGLPRGGARLHLLETLRAAAPWQKVRGRGPTDVVRSRVAIRREDFRIRRFVERTGTTVIFLVDASGSSALQRLSEAKGAIELLLAESYARRDRVSLIAFRGKGTEVLLPPTRALARAKKVLAAMPGGGGTPVALAIDAGLEQALATRRDGSVPLLVVLSDGRANIARDGSPGRPAAEKDAMAAAAAFAQFNVSALFVDTSPRGEPVARRIADAMRARYVLLPYADAKALGGLVRTAMQLADGGEGSR